MPWPIVLIVVCMDRGDKYLSIDTKTKFIEGSIANPPPRLDVLQKIAWLAWLDEG